MRVRTALTIFRFVRFPWWPKPRRRSLFGAQFLNALELEATCQRLPPRVKRDWSRELFAEALLHALEADPS